MTTKNTISLIETLKEQYLNAKCSLNFSTPFELLVAVCLSAQCTDERVNIVTKEVFQKYNIPEDFVNLQLEKIEQLIKPCGFYKNKAKNLQACSQKLINEFDSCVPKTMEELITLPGVGRKSANVILLNAFGICEGIAIDTHAKRICNRTRAISSKRAIKNRTRFIKIYSKRILEIFKSFIRIPWSCYLQSKKARM